MYVDAVKSLIEYHMSQCIGEGNLNSKWYVRHPDESLPHNHYVTIMDAARFLDILEFTQEHPAISMEVKLPEAVKLLKDITETHEFLIEDLRGLSEYDRLLMSHHIIVESWGLLETLKHTQ